MSIRFQCTNCKKTLQAPDSTSGKNAKCNSCGTLVCIPAPWNPILAGSSSSGSTQPQSASTHHASKPSAATIKCSNCSRTLRAPAGSEGKKLKCPCGAVLTMPSTGGNAPVAAPAVFSQTAAVPVSQPNPFPDTSADSSWLDVLPSAPTSPAAYSAQYSAPPSSYAPPHSPPASPYNSTNSGSSSQSSMANMYLSHAAQAEQENAYVERGQSWSVDWPKVGGGVLAMVGACVWFFGAWIFAGRIFIYPPILFIGGLIAVVNGLFSGD